ncbi:DUF397 domain-containing protein [Streptomyces sp. OF3]|uniref:DUF397 domain-containing protein n=1 Tax=Streptomyces alkaliterrae TaxID=2213162 RepID=A0A7W3WGV2_9ACTN|nr:DUF397 domain-containing protein [Streptomyces alkaliterrae]MBB1252094.1 DUF397 domain-containing protein [Streptomyces alkaliterrae]
MSEKIRPRALKQCPSSTLNWRKSTYSLDQGGDCVEVAKPSGDHVPVVHVRDSKTTDGPILRFPPTAWTAFLSATV